MQPILPAPNSSVGYSVKDFCLTRMTHSSNLLLSRGDECYAASAKITTRMFVVAGSCGFLGVGYAAVSSETVMSRGGIRRDVHAPVKVEILGQAEAFDTEDYLCAGNQEDGRGESFSSALSGSSGLMSSASEARCSKEMGMSHGFMQLVQLTASSCGDMRMSAYFPNGPVCGPRALFDGAIGVEEVSYNDLRGESAHSADATLTSISICDADINSRCEGFPCAHCTAAETPSNNNTSNESAFSSTQSSVLVSADDLGVLCAWQIVHLSTVVFNESSKAPPTKTVRSPRTAKERINVKCSVPNINMMDSVRIRSKHRLAHRIVLGSPITSAEVSEDGANVAVCTVTQAFLFSLSGNGNGAAGCWAPLRFQLLAVLDDSTTKNVLFRLRYVADVRSTPGRIKLWKMYTLPTYDQNNASVTSSQTFSTGNYSHFQYSDISIAECVESARRVLLATRQRLIAPSCMHSDFKTRRDETNVPTASPALPLLTLQEYLSWLGDGFGVISATQRYKEQVLADYVDPEKFDDLDESLSADKWTMDDFEEYIRCIM